MRIFWLFLFYPVVAFAEPVSIRSGEHETFSRLVLSIPLGTDWEVIQDEGSAKVVLNGNTDGYDTSQIFERIPRTRLESVVQVSQEQLQIDLACACNVDAFLWRPDRLVVDIVDGSESEGDEGESPPLIAQQPPPDPTAALPNLLMLRQPPVTQPFQDRDDETGNVDPVDLAATEAALLEGLARAATHGLLDAAQPPELVTAEPEIDSPNQPSESPMEVIPTISPHPGVDISTSLDRDLAMLGLALEEAIDQQCLPQDLLAVRDWIGEGSFHEQAAILIENLAGEFGQVPLEAQENLARFYVAYGFGAEATVVLSANEVSSQSRQILYELAALVDDEDQQYPRLLAQAGCDTSAALWSFLVSPQRLDDAASNEIQKHFFDLPQPLRGQIAPRLANSFVRIGNPEGAETVLRATRNQDIETTHQTQAAYALVADENGTPERALDVLSREADDNARIAPESIIRLIELSIEQDMTPRAEDLLLADALIQEFRNDPISNELEVALARGFAQAGQFNRALEVLAARDDEQGTQARDFVVATMTEDSDAVEFLELIYGEMPENLTSETQNAIARRLIDLGFAERAQDFLVGATNQGAAADRRYLRAEAAISMHDYATAIEALQGISDLRARELRSLAYSGMGEHQAALAAVNEGDLDQDQSTLQFRAEAWGRLTLQGDEALSSFAERVLDEPSNEPSTTLADRRVLLEQSAESRDAVENLLLRFDGAVSEDN